MLTAEVLASRRIEDVFMQSEYVRTVAVVVPSKEKGAFLAAYESFHAEAVTLKADAGMKKPSGNTGAKSMAFTVVTPQIEGADQNVDGRRLSVTVARAMLWSSRAQDTAAHTTHPALSQSASVRRHRCAVDCGGPCDRSRVARNIRGRRQQCLI